MLGNSQRPLGSSAAAEEEMPGEGEEGEGTDGEGEPVEGGVEGAELQGHHALSLRQNIRRPDGQYFSPRQRSNSRTPRTSASRWCR